MSLRFPRTGARKRADHLLPVHARSLARSHGERLATCQVLLASVSASASAFGAIVIRRMSGFDGIQLSSTYLGVKVNTRLDSGL